MPEPIVFDPGNGKFLVIDGAIVERDALRIVEKLQEYDDRLYVLCLDPDRAEINDAPFIVVREKDNGSSERVLEAWELDDKIIERVWAADCSKHDILDKLVKMEQAKKNELDKKHAEEMGSATELLVSAVKNPRSSFSFKDKATDDLVKVHDYEGVSRNKKKKSFS